MAAAHREYSKTRPTPLPGPLLDIVTTWPLPGVVVITAVGEVDIATAPRLHATLLDAVAAGPAHVVIDMAGVRFFCGAGVRPLVAAKDAAADGSFDLHLTGVIGNRPVAVVLDAIRLTEQFTIHSSVHAALVVIFAATTAATGH